jgi:6-phosphogluconolactonase (cycloisomerase 2 family)
MVFTINNADDHNAVVAFARDEEGGLELLGEYLTGGVGSGGGLGSQDSVAIGGEGHVYVVNPGDATISSMAIHEDFLSLVDIADTEGEMPTSLAVGDGRVYVLNAAGAGSVIGFDIDDGMFTPIDGASQPLSGHEAPAPAQIGITPDGDYLVVTERATNQILTYEVAGDGSLQPPVVNASEGMTPFGFGFTSTGVFVVSEAFGGGMNPGASAASSYRVADGGALWTFTASAPSGQTAACWLTIVDDQYAYTTNTGSDTISGYHVSDDGSIELFSVGGDLVELGDDMSPLDMAVSADGAFLYVLNGAGDNIMGFAVEPDGNLGALGDAIEVPAAAVGLAGF